MKARKLVWIYLLLQPVLGLVSIILSTLRIATQESYISYYLILVALLDVCILIPNLVNTLNKKITFLFFLLSISVIVGLLNYNELSRRFITDITNPLFFFMKISLFSIYWKEENFKRYLTYYSKLAFWGSLILAPLVYFIFNASGVRRISIFPPLELPFSNYIQSGGLFMLLTFIIILLYGKRAQFGAAVVTYFVFIFVFKRRQFIKYLCITIILLLVTNIVTKEFSDNPAVARLQSTINVLLDTDKSDEEFSAITAGRDDEISSVLGLMKTDLDFIFGLGIGFTYDLEIYNNEGVSNVHFTPLGFLSKYGIVFTIFMYLYFFSLFFNFKSKESSKEYIASYATVLFIFIESFFAYALFVTTILPIVIGYLESKNSNS